MKFPRWMNWLFLVFFAYILYLGNFSAEDDVVPAVQPASQQDAASSDAGDSGNIEKKRTYPKLAEASDFRYWKSALNPVRDSIYHITERKIGKGSLAGCGSKVHILLRGTRPDGASFDDTHDEKTPLIFTLGNAPYAALNTALLGMHQGGVRSVRAPLSALQKPGAPPVRIGTASLHITLVKLDDPENAADAVPFIVTPLTPGDTQRERAKCGEKITLTLTPILPDGQYGVARKWQEKLGTNKLDKAVSRAAQGMYLNEERLVLSPKNWRKQNKQAAFKIMRLE
jgi:hypothetical protein